MYPRTLCEASWSARRSARGARGTRPKAEAGAEEEEEARDRRRAPAAEEAANGALRAEEAEEEAEAAAGGGVAWRHLQLLQVALPLH